MISKDAHFLKNAAAAALAACFSLAPPRGARSRRAAGDGARRIRRSIKRRAADERVARRGTGLFVGFLGHLGSFPIGDSGRSRRAEYMIGFAGGEPPLRRYRLSALAYGWLASQAGRDRIFVRSE